MKSYRNILTYLFLLVIFAFIFPSIYSYHPLGDGDIYTHILMIDLISKTEDMESFFEKISDSYPSSTVEGYPFGLWLHGVIISKLTGVSGLDIAHYVPLIWFFLTTSSVFLLARLFLKDKDKSLIAVVLFITVPAISISILTVYSWVFILPFFILCIYLMFNDKVNIYIRLIIFSMFSSLIVLSHSGTTVSLLGLISVYLLLYILFTKAERRFSRYAFFITYILSLIFIMQANRDIYYNFYLKLLVPARISEGIIPFFSEYYVPLIQYENLFFLLPFSMIFVVFLEIVHMMREDFIGKASINFLQKPMLKYSPLIILLIFIFLSYPIFSDLKLTRGLYTDSIFALIIWFGPIQSFFFLFGFRNLGKNLTLLVFAYTIITLPFILLNSFGSSVGTGISRYVYFYSYLVFLVSANGLYNLINSIKNEKIVTTGLAFTFSLLFISSVIGNIYFLPPISETPSERSGLFFLREVPLSKQAFGPNMRQRIEVYAGVKDSHWTIPIGKKQLFLMCSHEIYRKTDYSYISCMNDLGVNYIIDSDRTRKFVGLRETIIDRTKKIDRIYTSNDFNVYSLD